MKMPRLKQISWVGLAALICALSLLSIPAQNRFRINRDEATVQALSFISTNADSGLSASWLQTNGGATFMLGNQTVMHYTTNSDASDVGVLRVPRIEMAYQSSGLFTNYDAGNPLLIIGDGTRGPMLPGRILMLTGGTDTPVITLDGDLGIITANNFIAGPGAPSEPSFLAKANPAQSAPTVKIANQNETITFMNIGPEGGVNIGGDDFAGQGNLWVTGSITGATITASTFTGPLDQTNIFTTGVTAGQGIFVGTGDEGWQQAVFDAEENAWGNGFVAGRGSFSGGRFQNATDSWVASDIGSFSGGNFYSSSGSYANSDSGSFSGGRFLSSSGSYAQSSSGSFSGGNFANSSGSSANSGSGSFSGGNFDLSSGSFASSGNGSFSGGNFDLSSGSFASSGNGSFSGGDFGSSSGSYASSGSGSFSGGNFYISTNVSLTVNEGLGYIDAEDADDVSITLDNGSLVVGKPPSSYTATFDNEIALLAPAGKVFGVDSSGNLSASGTVEAGIIYGNIANTTNASGNQPWFIGDKINTSVTIGNFGTLTVGDTDLIASGQIVVNDGNDTTITINGEYGITTTLPTVGTSARFSSDVNASSLTATNGVASYRSNLLAAVSVSNPWTNNVGVNCQVFCDSAGATVSINGTQVYSDSYGVTIFLQPNEWVSMAGSGISISYKPF